jgi:hypothetical protein
MVEPGIVESGIVEFGTIESGNNPGHALTGRVARM